MPKSNVKLDIKIERTKLNQTIGKFARDHRKTTWDVVKMATEWFTQSVIKVTPPIGKTSKKRMVKKIEGRNYKNIGHGMILNSDSRTRYKVPYRTNKKAGVKYFDKKKDANAFAKIKFRFIGKYGWLAAGQHALNKKIPTPLHNRVSLDVKAKGGEIQRTSRRKLRLTPFIILTNMVQNISRYAGFATAQALRKTKNRLRSSSRAIKKKYGKQWRSLQ